eukprot:Rhum_TRINITY_DN4245_c0_g1::Rhum_TRINITY_DN4245_c0_g1_i1::g.13473::m.13473/K09935/K09935; uncharacterized protein
MSSRSVIKFHEVNEAPYGVFSILSPHPVVVRHTAYPSAYHYFLTQKFSGTEYAHTIRQASSLWEVDRYVRRAEGLQRSDWDAVKMEAMLVGTYYKFKQNPDILALLLGTGSKVLVNHTASDAFWGDGGDGSGKNIMGVILMATRKRLLAEEKLRRRHEASGRHQQQQHQQHAPAPVLQKQQQPAPHSTSSRNSLSAPTATATAVIASEHQNPDPLLPF